MPTILWQTKTSSQHRICLDLSLDYGHGWLYFGTAKAERMEIVDSLPMAGGGQKVDKKVLERDIAEKLGRSGT